MLPEIRLQILKTSQVQQSDEGDTLTGDGGPNVLTGLAVEATTLNRRWWRSDTASYSNEKARATVEAVAERYGNRCPYGNVVVDLSEDLSDDPDTDVVRIIRGQELVVEKEKMGFPLPA